MYRKTHNVVIPEDKNKGGPVDLRAKLRLHSLLTLHNVSLTAQNCKQ